MLIIAGILAFILNIPFGYWRGNVKKFSGQWFLSIHCPVPIIILLRLNLGLGWQWTTYPILIGAYYFGQMTGGKWYKAWKKTMKVSGCLFKDIARSRWIIIISR